MARLSLQLVKNAQNTSMAADSLLQSMSAVAIPADALAMAAYMKHKFDFLGVKAPVRRQVFRAWLPSVKALPIDELAMVLWSYPFREMHYCAIDFLVKKDTQHGVDRLGLYENLLTAHAWWDSVDLLATKLIGRFFAEHPSLIGPTTSQWVKSNNMWLQRTCLLFQLNYKGETDTALLESFIRPLSGSGEFFIQKAIGWALRTYARTDPQWVRDFTDRVALKPLSYREATKHLKS